mmetsp:Transcript_67008/g.161960  ORF Transcript_67008/g.161960 Transcript_67008/m.161960 type:complete len:368 (-) Transcript_67008:8-1111(-)
MNAEHDAPRACLRQRDVHLLLETTAHGSIDLPRCVSRAEHEHVLASLANTVHLNEEFCLDAARRLALALGARSHQRINLVDEHDGVVMRPGHLEQVAHVLLRLALPLADQVGRRHRQERALRFRGHGLGQVGFSRPRRSVQQHALPWLPLLIEQLREPRRQNNGLLQGVLCPLQPRHIVPSDVGLLADDHGRQCVHQLLLLLVYLLLLLPVARSRRGAGVPATTRPVPSGTTRPAGDIAARQRFLQHLCASHVLRDLGHHLVLRGLHALRGMLEEGDEVLERLLVLGVRDGEILCRVGGDRLLHQRHTFIEELRGAWHRAVRRGAVARLYLAGNTALCRSTDHTRAVECCAALAGARGPPRTTGQRE